MAHHVDLVVIGRCGDGFQHRDDVDDQGADFERLPVATVRCYCVLCEDDRLLVFVVDTEHTRQAERHVGVRRDAPVDAGSVDANER